METVLAAVIIIFLILFAALTLSDAFLTSQNDIQAAWQEMGERMDEQSRVHIESLDATAIFSGTTVEVTMRNNGSVRLADYEDWDVIVQYYDTSTPSGYQIAWLPYVSSVPASNQWSVGGLYIDAASNQPEQYEPGIWNPGEEIILTIVVNPAVGIGKSIQAAMITPVGVGTSTITVRNIPPVLAANTGVTVNEFSSRLITSPALETTDADNTTAELVYTVTTAPAGGTLSLGSSFTQADIDAGLLTYTHISSSPDSFIFDVSDGIDTISSQTFTLTINQPPALVNNSGITVGAPGSTVNITSTELQYSDADNTAAQLTYSIVFAPTKGTLSLGSSFTQADIDAGLLSYTNSGVVSTDVFQFQVSDGEATLATVTFTIGM